jgi:hypothetical protein
LLGGRKGSFSAPQALFHRRALSDNLLRADTKADQNCDPNRTSQCRRHSENER